MIPISHGVVCGYDLMVEPALFDRFMEIQQWAYDDLDRHATEQIDRWVLHMDPKSWVEATLVERGSGGDYPWRLWDYQIDSLRYRGETSHRCGAEVGKTRELVALVLWKSVMSIRYPDPDEAPFAPRFQRAHFSLIGAALDGHLDSIWDELIFQLNRAPGLRRLVNWDQTKKKPYRKIVFVNGSEIHLRAAGLAGDAFRGLHVDDLYFDEAALIENPKVWAEFWRAKLPYGSETRIYSTPNGNRQSEFSRICDEATRAQTIKLARPGIFDPFKQRMPGSKDLTKDESVGRVCFWWPKPLMPVPFWSKQREREYIEMYGSREAAGYRQNVMGEDGDASGVVFDYDSFVKVCEFVKGYSHVELRYDDGRMWQTVRTLDPEFSGYGKGGGSHEAVKFLVQDEPTKLDPDEGSSILTHLKPWLPGAYPGKWVGGIDAGWSKDPCEIILVHLGDKHVWKVRISLIGWDSAAWLRKVVEVVDWLARPWYGWGLDATGRGQELDYGLRHASPSKHKFGDRLTGFVFGTTLDARDPATGKVAEIESPGGKKSVRRIKTKEQATQILEYLVDGQKVLYPMDLDIVAEWTSHTATPTASGSRKFSEIRDHTIEAMRCAEMRRFQVQVDGGPTRAVKATRYLKVKGARRDSIARLKKF